MKKKILSLFAIFGVLFNLALSTITIPKVSAEETCERYRNYYFFVEANAVQTFKDKFKSSSNRWSTSRTTTFPKGNFEGTVGEASITEGDINLSRTGNGADTWSLQEFYTKYLQALKSGGRYVDGTNSYLLHGAWEGTEVTSGYTVDLSDFDASTLANASVVVPVANTTINVDHDLDSESVSATIDRDYSNTNVFTDTNMNTLNYQMKAINVPLKSGGQATPTLLSPALFYIEYMACTGEPDDPDDPVVKPRYSYVIHYVDADTGEKLHPNKTATSVSDGTERDIDSPEIKGYTLVNSNDRVVHVKIEGANFEYTVKYKKSETFDAVIEYQDSKTGETLNDPWTSNDLPNGHKENVTSPEIENCKIVKTGDDVVEVEIKDQDFHYVVKYECTVPDVPENPKTGDALIFIVWAVGAAALGYSIYYFNKYYKKNSI